MNIDIEKQGRGMCILSTYVRSCLDTGFGCAYPSTYLICYFLPSKIVTHHTSRPYTALYALYTRKVPCIPKQGPTAPLQAPKVKLKVKLKLLKLPPSSSSRFIITRTPQGYHQTQISQIPPTHQPTTHKKPHTPQPPPKATTYHTAPSPKAPN